MRVEDGKRRSACWYYLRDFEGDCFVFICVWKIGRTNLAVTSAIRNKSGLCIPRTNACSLPSVFHCLDDIRIALRTIRDSAGENAGITLRCRVLRKSTIIPAVVYPQFAKRIA